MNPAPTPRTHRTPPHRHLQLAILAMTGAILLGNASPAQGQATVYDGFDYAVGDLGGMNGGTGWSSAWGGGTSAKIAANSLLYNDGSDSLTVTGNKVNYTGWGTHLRTLTTAYSGDGATFWYSFLVTPSADNNMPKIMIRDSLVPGKSALQILGRPTDGFWQLSDGNFDSAGATFYTNMGTCVPGETYFFAIEVTFSAAGNEHVRVFINPPVGALGATVPAYDAAQAEFSRVDQFEMFMPTDARLDEIRFGATYADVAPGAAIVNHTVTFTATVGGTVNGAAMVSYTVIDGADCPSVTATPEDGYTFLGWYGDRTGTTNPLTITTVAADLDIEARFYNGPAGLAHEPFTQVPAGAAVNALAPSNQPGFSGNWATTVGSNGTIHAAGLNYTDGSNTLDAAGTALTRASWGGTQISLDAAPGGVFDNAGRVTGGLIGGANADGKSLYLSFLVNGVDGSSDTLVELKDSADTQVVGVRSGNSGTDWRLQTQAGYQAPTGVEPSAATTYFMVMRVDFVAGTNNDQFRLYVNPSLAAEPGTAQATINDFDVTDLKTLQVYTNGTTTRIVDEIRIGTTYASVAPRYVPPHVVTFTAATGGTVNGAALVSFLVADGGDCPAVTPAPDAGNEFTGWTGSHVGTENPLILSNVTADMNITATFDLLSYVVTFQTDGNGTVNGATEVSYTVDHGANCPAVTATGNLGYHFLEWSGDHAGTEDPLTLANITVDMTVMANFAVNEYAVVFETDGTAGATLTGGVERITQTVLHGGDCTSVEAFAPVGHEFLGWTGDLVSGDNPLTVINVTADLTLTAGFGQRFTTGSTLALDADLVDGLATPGMFFLKPKVYGVYTDPVKLIPGKKATAKVLTKVDKLVGTDAVTIEWAKKIKLYNSKTFKAAQAIGTTATGWLAVDGNQDPLVIPVHLATKEAIPADQPVLTGQLPPPEIGLVEIGLPDAKGNQTLVITGTWFGTKKPKVWREYTVPTKGPAIKMQKYKVVAPADPAFVDSKNKLACMQHDTGASKVVVIVPAAPKGTLNGILVIDNGVGMDTDIDPTVGP